MQYTLYDFQQRAIDDIVSVIDQRPILVSPTGSGKTVMGAALVHRCNVPTLWFAHRIELIEQAANSLGKYDLVCGIIKAGYAPMPLAPVQVASVQTLVRRDMPRAGLVVLDECHHATAGTYQTILESYPNVPLVGLTATPFRLDGAGLGDLFGTLVVAARPDELCESGVLHAPKVWASKSPDLRGVKMIGGDYSTGALSKKTNIPELTADIVGTWRKHAAGKRTVVFAVDVIHSKAITAALQIAGIPTEHLDGKTSADERDGILGRLASGATLIVCNCMVLTEGWDLPALECAIIARPTASLNLHLQMIGRIMRAADGKDGAIVLDHAGNHHVHGLVTRRINYSLDGEKVGHSEPLGLRRCTECGLLYDVNLTACNECGCEPVVDSDRDRPEIHGDGELSEFDDADFSYRQQIWNLYEAEREAAEYLPGWSVFRFFERFKEYPTIGEIDGVLELIDVTNATMEHKQAVYERLLNTARSKEFADGWASYRYREIFGVWPRGFVSAVRGDDREEIQKRWAEKVTL